MTYEGMVYRPPSEAYSLLVQVTIGCSHNDCTFCSMYKEKKFRIRKMEDIHNDLKECSKHKNHYKRVFLCDGNALVLKTEDLKQILLWIKEYFPDCERVGAYAAPLDILRKTSDELKELYDLGLKILYIGLESGSDTVLKRIKKGVTKTQMIEAANIVKPTGIKMSVMVITGIGSQDLWQEHATETADAINKMEPDYLGLLALMVEDGTELKEQIEKGEFKLLTPKQIVEEMHLMVSGINLQKKCLFSSIHASNYINLRGELPAEKGRLMKELQYYLQNEQLYKNEIFRGL